MSQSQRKQPIRAAARQEAADQYLTEAAKLLEPHIMRQLGWRFFLLSKTAEHYAARMKRKGEGEHKEQLAFDFLDIQFSPQPDSCHRIFVYDVLALRHILHEPSDAIDSTTIYRHKSYGSINAKLETYLARQAHPSPFFNHQMVSLSAKARSPADRGRAIKKLEADARRLRELLKSRDALLKEMDALVKDYNIHKGRQPPPFKRVAELVEQYNGHKEERRISAENAGMLLTYLGHIFGNEEKVNRAYDEALNLLAGAKFPQAAFKRGELSSIAKERLSLLSDSYLFPSRADFLALLFKSTVRDSAERPQLSFLYLNMLKSVLDFEAMLLAKKAQVSRGEPSEEQLLDLLLNLDARQLEVAEHIMKFYKYLPQEGIVQKSTLLCLFDSMVAGDDVPALGTLDRLSEHTPSFREWRSKLKPEIEQLLQQDGANRSDLQRLLKEIAYKKDLRKDACKALERKLHGLAGSLPPLDAELLRDELRHVVKHSEYKRGTKISEAALLFSSNRRLEALLELVVREPADDEPKELTKLRANRNKVGKLREKLREYEGLILKLDSFCFEKGMLGALAPVIELEASFKHDGDLELVRYSTEKRVKVLADLSTELAGDSIETSLRCVFEDGEGFDLAYSQPIDVPGEGDGSILLHHTKPRADMDFIKNELGVSDESNFLARLHAFIEKHRDRYLRIRGRIFAGELDLLDMAEERRWAGAVVRLQKDGRALRNPPSLLDPMNEILDEARRSHKHQKAAGDLALYSFMNIVLALRDEIAATRAQRIARKSDFIKGELQALRGIMQ